MTVDDEIARKAARLAAVYGDDWNLLSQDERRKYINCVDAIQSAANHKGPKS